MNTGYNHSKFKDPRLARFVPTDMEHVEKYPLTRSTMPAKPVSIIMGVDWYSDFDNPVKDKDNKWWVGKDPNNLGYIRGGHAVTIPKDIKLDTYGWYLYYNQLFEGKCVGEAVCRAMSIENRKRYDVDWIWNRAKDTDEWAETKSGDNNGTSVRAALEIARTEGLKQTMWEQPNADEGIQVYRWATNTEDALNATGNATYKRLGAMPFLNSWGKEYPRLVWMPCETHERLRVQLGEYGIYTDK